MNKNTPQEVHTDPQMQHPLRKNYESKTIKAIANLATATAFDCATTARLTETNARLTKELKNTQQKLVKALEKLAQLSANCAPLAPKPGKENKYCPLDRHYCWAHGYLSTNTSGSCKNPAAGHKRFATARKPLGGSTAKQDKWLKRVTKIEN